MLVVLATNKPHTGMLLLSTTARSLAGTSAKRGFDCMVHPVSLRSWRVDISGNWSHSFGGGKHGGGGGGGGAGEDPCSISHMKWLHNSSVIQHCYSNIFQTMPPCCWCAWFAPHLIRTCFMRCKLINCLSLLCSSQFVV